MDITLADVSTEILRPSIPEESNPGLLASKCYRWMTSWLISETCA